MTGGGSLGVSGSLTTRSSSFSTPPASSSFFSFFSSVPGLRLGFRGSGTSATTRTPYSSSNIGTGGSGVRSKTSASISALGRTSGTSILFSGEGFGAPAVSVTAGGVSKTIEIVGGSPSFVTTGMAASDCKLDSFRGEDDWSNLETDLDYWTKTLRPIQWYPGHIAKTEKELKDQLKLMDVVIEVRDARIPSSTSHPQMDLWLGNRKRILVLNREDMISTSDRNAWASYFARQGTRVVFSNGQLGMGSMKLSRLAKTLAADVNVKRRAKGLLPRAVRAGIVGYPNVGKSSLINRLLKRRMCPAASRPGVTRELKWVQFGKDLELLDSPGILPMRISNQSAAIKLAICDDIGERSYDVADVAAILVQMLVRIPSVGTKALYNRYRIETDGQSGQIFVHKLAMKLFSGDVHQAAFRILTDFRKGKFGWISLERPPS